MRILFSGTGASDWKLKDKGQGEYRRFTSAILNDDLLLDPGPHISDFAEWYGSGDCLGGIRDVLLTHSHDDHFQMDQLKRLCADKNIRFWCHEAVVPFVEKTGGLTVHPIPCFAPTCIGSYVVTAVPANHGTGISQEQACHYMIEQNGRRIFYGCDGAWLRRDTWYYMKDYEFDLMVLDGTLGDAYGDHRIFEHNSLRMVELMAETFRKTGVLKEPGRIMITHLSRKSHGTQAEVEERLRYAGIEVAYDGCLAEI